MLTLDEVHLPGSGRSPIFCGLSLSLGYRRALLIAERDDLTAGFINLVIGSRRPSSGRVRLTGRPSWPIGQAAIVRSVLTGRETVRFLADIYKLDARACILQANRWFGRQLMGTAMLDWPPLERVKFERLAVLWPQFDVLVVYGAGLTGDQEFDQEWMAAFQEKMEGRGLLAVAPPLEPWSWLCDITVLLRSDEAICYDNVTEALLAAQPVAAGDLIEETKRLEPGDDEIF